MSLTAAQDSANVVWEPHPGSQWMFLHCPIFECLYEGTRGPGKTDALLMDFAQHVGEGYGPAWRGVLFREEFPQLEDVIVKSKKWFHRIFPRADFIEGRKMKWVFPEGEELLFRAARREKDYWKYHGHEYPWVGWEELTNWAEGNLYEKMKSVCRSSHPNMPRKYRATANPFGPGHSWVKQKFVDSGPPGTLMMDDEGRGRVRVHGSIWENKHILENDPEYLLTLKGLTDPNLRKAWLKGSWDIVAGGYFADVWNPNLHYIEPFEIPRNWRWRLSFDWGSSAPASLGIWAISDGTQPEGAPMPIPAKSAVRVDELYTVKYDSNHVPIPNQGKGQTNKQLGQWMAHKIKHYTDQGAKFNHNQADPSVFVEGGGDSDWEQIEKAMKDEGVHVNFEAADNERRPGWQNMKAMLKETTKDRPEDKLMLVFNRCLHFKRTVPMLQRDEKDMDDVDTTGEDHIADETRYFVQSLDQSNVSTTGVSGL